MILNAVIHQAEEGGYWGEIPAIKGCVSQGETVEELMDNLKEAAEGCLSVDIGNLQIEKDDRIVELSV
ncbi:MAG: hypothetical protein A2014_03200 [Spirochaetes bacterium GWF1_49_6]|nr:MAG: hypothetical protein A2014_03200 [Spirochaetes bacterium GWF1_49_6]